MVDEKCETLFTVFCMKGNVVLKGESNRELYLGMARFHELCLSRGEHEFANGLIIYFSFPKLEMHFQNLNFTKKGPNFSKHFVVSTASKLYTLLRNLSHFL